MRLEFPILRGEAEAEQEGFEAAIQSTQLGNLAGQSQPDDLRLLQRGKGAGAVTVKRKWANLARRAGKGHTQEFRPLYRDLTEELQRQVGSIGGNPANGQGR